MRLPARCRQPQATHLPVGGEDLLGGHHEQHVLQRLGHQLRRLLPLALCALLRAQLLLSAVTTGQHRTLLCRQQAAAFDLASSSSLAAAFSARQVLQLHICLVAVRSSTSLLAHTRPLTPAHVCCTRPLSTEAHLKHSAHSGPEVRERRRVRQLPQVRASSCAQASDSWEWAGSAARASLPEAR